MKKTSLYAPCSKFTTSSILLYSYSETRKQRQNERIWQWGRVGGGRNRSNGPYSYRTTVNKIDKNIISIRGGTHGDPRRRFSLGLLPNGLQQQVVFARRPRALSNAWIIYLGPSRSALISRLPYPGSAEHQLGNSIRGEIGCTDVVQCGGGRGGRWGGGGRWAGET